MLQTTTPNLAEIISSGSNFVMALAAVIAVGVAHTQLKKLVDANRQAALVLVVQIEIAMLDARRRMSDLSLILHGAQSSTDSEHIRLLQTQVKESFESYLNLLDRYCASVRRGIVPEKDAKLDYRDQIREVVRSDEFKPFFGTGTNYVNIQKLHDKWSDEA